MTVRFEDALARGGRLVYTCVGTSMLPMLRQRRDLLVIERKEGRLKKYDVPLYKRGSGQYVLHRVVKVCADGYVLCGDDQWKRERGVTDGQIIGVLTAFVRDGREISVTDKWYRLYARLWCGLFWPRAAFLWCAAMPRRLKKLRACKRRLRQPVRKPVSQWPLEKRVVKAMGDYERREGHLFDLEHPTLFTEKRVWYGLFFEHPDLTRLYDKYLFKGYIEEKLGPGWTAPLYGMWTSVRGLKRDWDRLPDAFVLKSNCSSFGKNVVFVRDKKSVDTKALFQKVKTWLDPLNTGINSYLKAYAGITPRIIAEKLLTGNNGQLTDYKVLCFDGKPEYIYCISGRFASNMSMSTTFYDLDWNKLPVIRRGRRNEDYEPPVNLRQMVEIAGELSKGFPQIRVDFYESEGRLYIGELTLYAGLQFESEEWDREFGEKFVLPDRERT